MKKPWNGFLGTGDTEFEERIVESVAVGLCWIFLTFLQRYHQGWNFSLLLATGRCFLE